ncbi:hypothetical protein FRC11_002559, partial [Ceratobasidium sp. 423]
MPVSSSAVSAPQHQQRTCRKPDHTGIEEARASNRGSTSPVSRVREPREIAWVPP